MKILILNWRDPMHPHAGGAELATLKHAEYWVAKGHEVTWFSSKFDRSKEEELIKNIKIIRKGNYVFGVQFFAFLYYLNDDFDLVVDQIHGLPFFTPLYAKKRLAYVHELARNVIWHNPYSFPLNYIVGILSWVVEPLIYRFVYFNTRFMTVSKSTKDELISFGVKPQKIRIINNGVSVIKNNFQKNKLPTIIYLGALATDKGIEDALKVFEILHKEKKYNFWVAGKGEKKYRNMLKKKKYIKYFGYVNEKKKFELLAKAHILLNPSMREGWGLVNIEANSMSTPVVGYRVAGMKDSVLNRKNGILVDYRNTYQLAKEITELIEDSKRYNKFSKAAIKWAGKFDWKKSSKESLNYILKNFF